MYKSSSLIAPEATPSYPYAHRREDSWDLARAEWMGVSGLFPEFRYEGWLRQRHPVKNPSYDRAGSISSCSNCRRANCIFRRPRVFAARFHPLGATRGALRILVHCRGIWLCKAADSFLPRFHFFSRYASPYSRFTLLRHLVDNFTVFSILFINTNHSIFHSKNFNYFIYIFSEILILKKY